MKDLRPGIRKPDRKTLLEQAKQGAAVLWCRDCDHFWREWADKKTGWVAGPGHAGCPECGCIYVVWENFPEAMKT